MFDALRLGRKIAEEKQNEMEDVFLGVSKVAEDQGNKDMHAISLDGFNELPVRMFKGSEDSNGFLLRCVATLRNP
ncbi:hypothetical protein VNO80_00196 [Phaseolus coccineus]|uniref:Uncharacterized protein n=1 Tax=Phaseolus coccineus TaxID=3886 RepID=A0AAN9RLZ4_PHACN